MLCYPGTPRKSQELHRSVEQASLQLTLYEKGLLPAFPFCSMLPLLPRPIAMVASRGSLRGRDPDGVPHPAALGNPPRSMIPARGWAGHSRRGAGRHLPDRRHRDREGHVHRLSTRAEKTG